MDMITDNDGYITLDQLNHLLHQGVVKCVFQKKNGEQRTLFGTLCDDLIEYKGAGTPRSRKAPEGIVCLWDVENEGFRIFWPDQLLSAPLLVKTFNPETGALEDA